MDVLQSGLLQGKLPGRRDGIRAQFHSYYLELTTSQLHFFDGQESDTRKELLSVHIDSSDTAGVETKVRMGEFRFYLDRPGDGKYVFKVPTDTDRDEWIRKLQRVIDIAPPPPPGSASNSKDAVQNSGSASGEIPRPSQSKAESRSVPSGGSDGKSHAKMEHSADSEFQHEVKVTYEDMPAWFWGTMTRQECEDQLREKGEMGEFVVRVSASGHHVLSFLQVDGGHHHRITTQDGIWRFKIAALNAAEGESLADLMDSYMKNCTEHKNIKPYSGGGPFEKETSAEAIKKPAPKKCLPHPGEGLLSGHSSSMSPRDLPIVPIL